MRPRASRIVLGALALLAAASPSLLQAAEPLRPQATPPAPAFNRLNTYEEIVGYLKGYAAAYPKWAKLESIGKSAQGRDLWLITLTNPDDRLRPLQAGHVHRRQHPRQRGAGRRGRPLHRRLPPQELRPAAAGDRDARPLGLLRPPHGQPGRPLPLVQRPLRPGLPPHRHGAGGRRPRRRLRRGRLRRRGRRRLRHRDAQEGPHGPGRPPAEPQGPAPSGRDQAGRARRLDPARQGGLRQRPRRPGQRGHHRLRRPEPHLGLLLGAPLCAGRRRPLSAVDRRDPGHRPVGAPAPQHRGRAELPQQRPDDPPRPGRQGRSALPAAGPQGLRPDRQGGREAPARLPVLHLLEGPLHGPRRHHRPLLQHHGSRGLHQRDVQPAGGLRQGRQHHRGRVDAVSTTTSPSAASGWTGNRTTIRSTARSRSAAGSGT